MKPCNIFQLQRLSVNDGEGIRTTVFFKGCALRCQWCANPESWAFDAQLMFFPHKCTGCGNCVIACKQEANVRNNDGAINFISSNCINCGACLTVCPADARQVMGEELTIDAVMTQLKKDYIFYLESGGGVTFSGGEPFLHPEYLRLLNARCHQLGINTAVESCAYFDFAACQDIIANIDQLFFDLKIMDSARHKQYTGVTNERILANIEAASKINDNIFVRVPVITGVNDSDENMSALAKFLLAKTSITRVELLPYHKLGLEKMTALGMPAVVFETPSEAKMEELNSLLVREGMTIVSFK
ncbi:4-hydroxyphenylacetate decarboxylase activating enzyme [bioreactor metagenome]|uniref:4-hydroxyphenylacetate decarboxylase activating enzyme n=1 Tax=bioreactor metagenome TaxID=1076179 RepID=A0A645A2H5_9ZZZZ